MPPRWVTPQLWDLALGGCGHCVHWGQEDCGSLGRAGGSGQMRQRGCRKDRGCLGAPQAARETPRAAHPPWELTPAGRGQRGSPGEGVRMLPVPRQALYPVLAK